MIASTCSRLRPVRRAIGFATDLATRPRTPVSEALPIATALSCAVMTEWLPRTRPFETSGPPRWAGERLLEDGSTLGMSVAFGNTPCRGPSRW